MKTEESIKSYTDRFQKIRRVFSGEEPKVEFVGAKIKASTKERLESLAAKTGAKKSTLVSEAIEMYLDIMEQEVE